MQTKKCNDKSIFFSKKKVRLLILVCRSMDELTRFGFEKKNDMSR